MATPRRQRIAIFFLGGSGKDSRAKRSDQVLKSSDVDVWLENMGEMSIIADTAGFFIEPGEHSIGLPEWSKLAKKIHLEYLKFDGFVVFHEYQTIPAAAVVLSLMLKNLEKPVVLVGSSAEQKGFSAKASVINAVQVAISDVAEVVVVQGSTIFRGSTSLTKIIQPESLQGEVLGKIDFGVRLNGNQQKRSKRRLQVQAGYDANVMIVDYLPGLDVASLPVRPKQYSGVFISSSEGMAIPDQVISTVVHQVGMTPIGLFSTEHKKTLPKTAMLIEGGSRSTAILRFMWALGQTLELAKLKKLVSAKEPS